MKTVMIKYVSFLAVSLFLLAGCGGGGGSSSAPVPGTALAPVTDPAVGGTATASFSMAAGINNDGQVIGFAETGAGSEFKAALWTVDPAGTAASAPSPLKPIGGNSFSAGFGIAETGNVVGQSGDGTALVAVIWKVGVAEPEALPPLFAGGNSNAFGVSPDGTLIAGEAVADAAGTLRAVVWQVNPDGSVAAPVVLPVNSFASGTTLSPFSSASNVSNSGWVAGEVEDGAGVSHAVLWRPDGGGAYVATDLHAVGEPGSAAFAVNAAGQVVGEAVTGANVFVPVLWADNGSGVFTRTSLAAAGSALALNDTGRAAGFAGAGTVARATVWTLPSGTPAAIPFATASQVYGINDDNLTVGANNGKGFVVKVN
jgi:probable HAF family extracellular repeat protein